MRAGFRLLGAIFACLARSPTISISFSACNTQAVVVLVHISISSRLVEDDRGDSGRM